MEPSLSGTDVEEEEAEDGGGDEIRDDLEEEEEEEAVAVVAAACGGGVGRNLSSDLALRCSCSFIRAACAAG